MHFFQISTGLGAGNLGDEMMARAFWRALPPDWAGEVELFPMSAQYSGGYPSQHTYVPVESGRYRRAAAAGTLGIMACGTPVHEVEGLHFPMRFIAERLDAFHAAGTPVDAVGVGVDRLYTRRGRALFEKSFLPIRSWTVRNEACREALLDLNVPPERIVVGADWAWAYEPTQDCREWARTHWQSLGVDPDRPLLAVNVVNLVWRKKSDFKRALAEALDHASQIFDCQVAFVCNECRSGSLFDAAAAREVASQMSSNPVVVENAYWSVDQMMALLSFCATAVAMRYHVGVMAAQVGLAPVLISRSQKTAGLATDLGLPSMSVRSPSPELLVSVIQERLESSRTESMRQRTEQMRNRVCRNFDLLLT